MVYYTDCFEFSSVRSRIGEFGFVVYFNFLHKKAIGTKSNQSPMKLTILETDLSFFIH